VALVAGSTLIARPAGAAQLTLSWNDNSNGTAGIKVERKTGSTGTYAQIGTTGAGLTTYEDTTVVAGTTYCYRVRAWNAAGDSDYSNEACGSSATGLAVTAAKAGTGTGTVTSSPPGITCGGDCFESFPSGTIVTLTATPASGSSFTGWTTGCAGTAPCTVTGNSPVTVTAAFAAADNIPPTQVKGLVATAFSSNQIGLTWTASSDAVGVSGYLLERCEGRGKCSDFAQIAAASVTSYTDTGLSPNTRYRYRVRAADQTGNLSAYSQSVTATTFKVGR
jgi:fibronectin type 3 domain-containing protein